MMALAEREAVRREQALRAWAVPIVLAIAGDRRHPPPHLLRAGRRSSSALSLAYWYVHAQLAAAQPLALRHPRRCPRRRLAAARRQLHLRLPLPGAQRRLRGDLQHGLRRGRRRAGSSRARQLEQSPPTPLLARAVALLAPWLCSLAGLPFGLRELWRRHRKQPFALLFGARRDRLLRHPGAAPRPARLGDRQPAQRVPLHRPRLRARLRRPRGLRRWRSRPAPGPRCSLAGASALVLVGGAISGWPWDSQLAPPLRVSADGRTISSPPLALAEWAERRHRRGPLRRADAPTRPAARPGRQGRRCAGSLPDSKTSSTTRASAAGSCRCCAATSSATSSADRREVSADGIRGYYFSTRGHDREGLLPKSVTPSSTECPEPRGSTPTARSRSSTWRGPMRGHRDLRLAAAARCSARCWRCCCRSTACSLLFAAAAGPLPARLRDRRGDLRPPPISAAAQSLVLSLGLSLAVLALGGLLLNYLPGGIRAVSWALLLVLVVLAGCRAAALRRPRRRRRPPHAGRGRGSPRREAGLLAGGAALAIVAALVLAFVPLSAKQRDRLHRACGSCPRRQRPGPGVPDRRRQRGADDGRLPPAGPRSATATPKSSQLRARPGETRVLELRPASQRRAPAGRDAGQRDAVPAATGPTSAYRRVSAWIGRPRAGRMSRRRAAGLAVDIVINNYNYGRFLADGDRERPAARPTSGST